MNLYAYQGAVTGSTIENNFIRNSGDDGIALWSASAADTNDTVTQNTVDSPGLANNLGVYGGGSRRPDHQQPAARHVEYGGGLEISQNYGSVAFAGTLMISGNEFARTGQFDPGWDYGTGAIWIYPKEGSINSTINISSNTFLNSPYEAFMFQNSNAYSGSATLNPPSSGNSVNGVNITNNTVTNVGTFVFQDQAPGSATVSGTTATGVGDAGIFSCGSGFTLNQGSGNSGFGSTVCQMPTSSPLWVYPGVTTFQGATVGQTTATQQVAIVNTSSAATSLGSITASSGFSVSQDSTYPCGSSLDATAVSDNKAWCMVDVSFTPDGRRHDRRHPLDRQQPVHDGDDGAADRCRNRCILRRRHDRPGTQQAGDREQHNLGFPASNAVDGNTSTYWESTDGTWPATLSVDLGATDSLSSVASRCRPPGRRERRRCRSSALQRQQLDDAGRRPRRTHGARQTATTFDQSAVRHPRIAMWSSYFTANNVQNGAQVAEFDIYGTANPNLALNQSATASSTTSGSRPRTLSTATRARTGKAPTAPGRPRSSSTSARHRPSVKRWSTCRRPGRRALRRCRCSAARTTARGRRWSARRHTPGTRQLETR